jgi:hypothetical protein
MGFNDVRFTTKVKRGESLEHVICRIVRQSSAEQKQDDRRKVELIAKSLVELSKTLGSMERDISRIKNAGGKSE